MSVQNGKRGEVELGVKVGICEQHTHQTLQKIYSSENLVRIGQKSKHFSFHGCFSVTRDILNGDMCVGVNVNHDSCR